MCGSRGVINSFFIHLQVRYVLFCLILSIYSILIFEKRGNSQRKYAELEWKNGDFCHNALHFHPPPPIKYTDRIKLYHVCFGLGITISRWIDISIHSFSVVILIWVNSRISSARCGTARQYVYYFFFIFCTVAFDSPHVHWKFSVKS